MISVVLISSILCNDCGHFCIRRHTHGCGLSHCVSKNRSSKPISKISAVCVVCGSEKLLNFNKNLAKLYSSINNLFHVFTLSFPGSCEFVLAISMK